MNQKKTWKITPTFHPHELAEQLNKILKDIRIEFDGLHTTTNGNSNSLNSKLNTLQAQVNGLINAGQSN